MKKISAVMLKAIPMIMALLLMLGILYAESVTANAVSGPRPSNQAGIVVGFTHFGDSEVMYLGNSKSKTASFEGFKYNKSNNTLTLDNIGTDEYYGLSVYDMGDDFKINVKGKNSLGYLYVYSNVKDRMNLTITGTGTLTINSDGAYGAAIHGYANGKSNTKITIDNTVNLNLHGGYNVFEEKNEKVIEVTGAKSSKQSDVFKIGGKKTGSTKVSKKKSKKGYNYKYGGTKLIIKRSGKSFLKSSSSSSASSTAAKKTNTTYTVKYNLNGGKGSISSQKKTKGKNLKLRTKKPTKAGYIFKGWSVKKNGAVKYKAGATYKANSNVTLYASWKRIPKIHILAIGGFNSEEEKKGASSAGDDAEVLYKKFNKNKLSGYEKGNTVLYTPKGAPTVNNINKKIKEAFGSAKEEDLCFFLYAGHGTCDPDHNGLGMTTGGDVGYYPYTDLINKVDKISKAHVVMLISTCHSGGFAKAAKANKNKNVTVFTACDTNETSGNSAFTISNNDKYSTGLHFVSVASSYLTGKDTRRGDLVDLVAWGMNLKKIGKKGKVTAGQLGNYIENNIPGGRHAQTWVPYPKKVIYQY